MLILKGNGERLEPFGERRHPLDDNRVGRGRGNAALMFDNLVGEQQRRKWRDSLKVPRPDKASRLLASTIRPADFKFSSSPSRQAIW